MSPTQEAANYLKKMKREKGESTESFAQRMYDMQMEIYSAWAGADVAIPWYMLRETTRKGWIKRAKQQ